MISNILQILGLQSRISQSLKQFFLPVGQNNFGNKIPFLISSTFITATNGWTEFNWFHFNKDLTHWFNFDSSWDNDWLILSTVVSAGSLIWGIGKGILSYCSTTKRSEDINPEQNWKNLIIFDLIIYLKVWNWIESDIYNQ